jgi:hypothetical protein
LPHLNQAKAVVVFDILENVMTQTAFLFSRGLNHGQEGLFELQTLFRPGIQFYDDDDQVPLSFKVYLW